MKFTVNAIASSLADHMGDAKASGHDIACAMAKDNMSYSDAHHMMHKLRHAVDHAEKCLATAAMKQAALDGKAINPELMDDY